VGVVSGPLRRGPRLWHALRPLESRGFARPKSRTECDWCGLFARSRLSSGGHRSAVITSVRRPTLTFVIRTFERSSTARPATCQCTLPSRSSVSAASRNAW
jgi:hypothetical protein